VILHACESCMVMQESVRAPSASPKTHNPAGIRQRGTPSVCSGSRLVCSADAEQKVTIESLFRITL